MTSQDLSSVPRIPIGDHTLEVTNTFTFLRSTISNTPFLEAELNLQISKAATAMAHLQRELRTTTYALLKPHESVLILDTKQLSKW